VPPSPHILMVMTYMDHDDAQVATTISDAVAITRHVNDADRAITAQATCDPVGIVTVDLSVAVMSATELVRSPGALPSRTWT
jgi:hypothetical protein